MTKAKIKKGTCHLIVEGEFLTNITRQLWADEGKPEKAFNILEAAFPTMTKADKFAILIGEKKLTGDSNKGCNLIKDTTKESLTLKNLLMETPYLLCQYLDVLKGGCCLFLSGRGKKSWKL